MSLTDPMRTPIFIRIRSRAKQKIAVLIGYHNTETGYS
jgi:hypothetical protein